MTTNFVFTSYTLLIFSIGISTLANANLPINTLSSADLVKRYDNNHYKTFDYDVNADGMKDKIITHKSSQNNFYSGDDLIVYLANANNSYFLSLKTVNHTDEAGWSLQDIMPRPNHSGFIVSIYFADRGDSKQLYYYELKNNQWLINNYVSEGTLITGAGYYCTVAQSNKVTEINYGESSSYLESEFEKYCPPLPTTYKVHSDKLEILDTHFKALNPSNYYIKGNEVDAFSQNEEWLKILYKNNTKYGWINKSSLSPLADR